MAISFYNQGDQDIYESGDHFIPQERFRLGYTAPPSIANAQTTSGITNTQAANPYLYPPQQGGGGGGLHNVYGYDPTKTKTFTKDVWSKTGPTEGWTTQDVTGYWSPSGWKTAKGKNINHLGLEVPTVMGTLIDKWAGIKPGEPQVGDIKGTFTKDLTEEEEAINAAAIASNRRRNLLNKIKAKAYTGPLNVGGGGQDISDIPAGDGATGGATLGTSTPTRPGGWHPGVGGNGGGGQTQGQKDAAAAQKDDPGLGGHAQGGRIGYERGRVVRPGGYSGDTWREFLASKSEWVVDPRDDSWKDVYYRWLDSQKAEGGRIGYREGELVDENIEGPGFDENLMAGFIDPHDALNDMSMEIFNGKQLHELTPEEYQLLIDMANEQAMGEQDQGIASLV